MHTRESCSLSVTLCQHKMCARVSDCTTMQVERVTQKGDDEDGMVAMYIQTSTVMRVFEVEDCAHH